MRCLQVWLRTVYIPQRHSLNKHLTMPNKVKDSFKWWTQPKNVLYRSSVLTKDPNNDYHHRCLPNRLGNAFIQQHSPRLMIPIGIQPAYKLARAKNKLQPLSRTMKDKVMRIPTDNVSSTFHRNRQERAQSHSLCMEAMLLWNWCISHNIDISASCLQDVETPQQMH